MALKVYVISHATTGAVLAAFTARDGADTTQLLADVVGASLPISIAPARIAPPTTPFLLDPSLLRVDEATSEDPTSLDPSSVLFAPWDYSATFDSTTNKFQSLSKGTAPAAGTGSSSSTLAITLPAAIAPGIQVAGWLQLYASGTGMSQVTPGLKFAPTGQTFTTAVSAAFAPLPGADTALLLVEGCAAYVGAFPLS
jgi:hypothetical protein